MPEKHFLKQMQALPLRAKVLMSYNRIREWHDHFNGDVCVSFSGGKDSTVLANLVHEWYPEVPLIFANTGLEYPEIQAFAKKMGAEFVRPKMSFSEVISTYGYPIISKENAEAIYYARRIKNSEGGGTAENAWNCLAGNETEQAQQATVRRRTADQKRREFNGSRVLCGGGVLSQKALQNGDEPTSRIPCQTCGRSEGITTQKSRYHGNPNGMGTRSDWYKRHQFLWGGVQQTGRIGEETPLPG